MWKKLKILCLSHTQEPIFWENGSSYNKTPVFDICSLSKTACKFAIWRFTGAIYIPTYIDIKVELVLFFVVESVYWYSE